MKCKDLLSLSSAKQEVWLEKNVQEYMEKVWDADHLGLVITFDESRLDDYEKNPDAYGTGQIIRSVFPELSEAREEEIDEGTILTLQERDYLEQALVDAGFDDGISYLGYLVYGEDGDVFAVFKGYAQGQGSMRFEFYQMFSSREEAKEHVDKTTYVFEI